ncbi:Ataxin-2 binding isoform F [Micractinium conductrix]|uniref:Ataxin-2 binding isoform F n=1 Tax=Micractinium conductrix TaxID=554055 RepID=A0A2P6V1W0_9CHLO|nr:Ataxin-2 binding isoform F [Micractinium conductrix]|eukprot:PSC68073.1 Ataxin-2 binding isoform F [Micractinium conductrix]
MWDAGGSPPASQPTAVEVHGLDAAASLLQLRQLFSQVAPVLQAVATLDGDSSTGLGLIISATEPAAAAAVELFNGYPLGGSYLRVQRSDGLANSLVNLLYSLDAPSSQRQQQQEQQQRQKDAESAANAQANATAAAAAFLEQQQQLLQHAEARVRREQQQQQQAWDAAARQQQQAQEREQRRQQGWPSYDDAQQHANGMSTNGMSTNGHANGTAPSLAQQQQHRLEAELRHLQLGQQQRVAQQQQQQAAAAAAGLPQRPGGMSWASAAAAAPSLAALSARPQTVAGNLAAIGSAATTSSNPGSDEWQMASGMRGRSMRHPGDSSAGGAGSSVSSGSPAPVSRSSGRHSDDRACRPGGQDSASADPTTKLWMGGIDGSASADTVRGVFGRFGPIYDYELQPATHEKGRTDQWGFVNYKRLSDANRAYEALVGEVIPELTGTRKLKLQFRPVDTRRPGGRR